MRIYLHWSYAYDSLLQNDGLVKLTRAVVYKRAFSCSETECLPVHIIKWFDSTSLRRVWASQSVECSIIPRNALDIHADAGGV